MSEKKYTFVIDENLARVFRRQLHLTRVLATMSEKMPDFLLTVLKPHLVASQACLIGLIHIIVGRSFMEFTKEEVTQFGAEHPDTEGGEPGPLPSWVKAHMMEVRDLLLSAQKAELLALPGPEREKALAELSPDVRAYLGL